MQPVLGRLVFLFCCGLTTGRCNAFQPIFVNQQKSRVLRPIFPDYVISCDQQQYFSGNFAKLPELFPSEHMT